MRVRFLDFLLYHTMESRDSFGNNSSGNCRTNVTLNLRESKLDCPDFTQDNLRNHSLALSN